MDLSDARGPGPGCQPRGIPDGCLEGPETTGQVREFESGATRDADTDKLDYEGFLSPAVLVRFAEYMHGHRIQSDGSLRDSDNWQKGIPLDAYMKSLWRHFMDLWLHHRGLPARAALQDTLCAVMFNTMGYLHEVLQGGDE